MYSMGKKLLEEEKANPKSAKPDFEGSLESLKNGLPVLQKAVDDLERKEQAYLLRKANLEDLSLAISEFRNQLDSLSRSVQELSALGKTQQEFNESRQRVIGKLEAVLDHYTSF